jgi:AraC-like DNA-binding protein
MEAIMAGIDLNKNVVYKFASFRYFEKMEHHINRFCKDNVLLLVFDGVLRFSENGMEKEVRAGEYYVQKKNVYQAGEIASDEPKYFYVHFDAEWSECEDAFPLKGKFKLTELSDLMKKMDSAAHGESTHTERQYLFLKLILMLNEKPFTNHTATQLSDYIEKNLGKISSLSDICEAFHYSKNYIIRIFKKEFGVSPIQYVNDAKIKRAMYLLETTSRPVKEITEECGYSDYPYFYKRFVRKTGLSPLRWRRQIQENPLSDR